MNNPGDLLRGGMLVSVNVRKQFQPGAIVVPRTAVFQTESGANVFTVTPMPPPPGAAAKGAAPQGPPIRLMQAKIVPVRLGLQTDTLSEVRSAQIQPGTTVITTRPDALQDKSLVAIGPSSSPAGGKAQ